MAGPASLFGAVLMRHSASRPVFVFTEPGAHILSAASPSKVPLIHSESIFLPGEAFVLSPRGVVDSVLPRPAQL